MVEKTSGSAQPDTASQTPALAHKYPQIEAMADPARQMGCFRQTLIGYFAGSKKFSSDLFDVPA
jgi:hypothetical protein